MGRIAPVIEAPLAARGLSLYAFKPQERFTAYCFLALSCGLLVGIPALVVALASFVAPGLTARERRLLVPFCVSLILFGAMGIAFAWLVIVPFAVGFFAGFAGDAITRELWSVEAYYSFVVTVLGGTGMVFLTPPIILAAVKIGLLSPRTLAAYRRHAVVAIFIIAAIVTPPDVASQLLVGIPLYVLFELTVLVARLFARPMQEAEHGST